MFWRLCTLVLAYSFSGSQSTNNCYFHQSSCLLNNQCNKTIRCPKNNVPGHCFALWQNSSTKGVVILNKGCWFKNPRECTSDNKCIGTLRRKDRKQFYFCCCTGDYCNGNITLDNRSKGTYTRQPPGHSVQPSPSSATEESPPDEPTGNHENFHTLLYSIVPIFGLALVLGCCLFMYHHQKQTRFIPGLNEEEPLNLHQPPSPVLSSRPIQKLEVVSQSQGGIMVWKAKSCLETVAVKVFPEHEKGAWMNENECYTLCNLSHENVLRFIAVEKHVDEIYTEYWLITEFHMYGSLSDYLKQHILSWSDLCQLAKTLACGLAYVHSEVKSSSFYKPCIAHRDVKSKNILVKSDLSCCIGDFGLALKFNEIESPGEMHGQVGTKRYMAPEVLEGAILFTRESFLRIDTYALGLVLWELASRCSVVDGPVEDYRLPFEEEVGLHPSLEDMQQVVVQQRIRPCIREDWRNHTGMASLAQTIEECWDQDGEARLTAQCVVQRICTFTGYNSNNSQGGVDQVPSVTINYTTNSSHNESSI